MRTDPEKSAAEARRKEHIIEDLEAEAVRAEIRHLVKKRWPWLINYINAQGSNKKPR